LTAERERIAMKIYVLAISMAAFLVTAAIAAEEFYVVQNPKTGNCKVSNKKDDGKNVMIGTTGYTTVEDAKAAKSKAAECKENKKK
jgi:hypothetical protein